MAQMYSIHVELEGWTVEEDSSDVAEAHDHFRPITISKSLSKVQSQDLLQLLLIEFEDLFVEPFSLPPGQFFDHSIHQKLNS